MVLEGVRRLTADYVAIDDGSIWTRDALWARVVAVLTETAGARVAKSGPGRPKRGPGSGILKTQYADRVAMVRRVYYEISLKKRRPAHRKEVAAGLSMSEVTFWRLRMDCELGWPP